MNKERFLLLIKGKNRFIIKLHTAKQYTYTYATVYRGSRTDDEMWDESERIRIELDEQRMSDSLVNLPEEGTSEWGKDIKRVYKVIP